ncbi:Mg2+/Co2+ transporter [Frankia torreyi]|uniref:Mg2+/Co2+ transporter n=1 Tax=Frankia torreyi TaxID=1856 RepID=A0A0D8B9A1_9ACTN|nr:MULTISPECIES: magnesium transporter CorA family protein [Frankia]KJE19957.1 Mg2+/Co2+ transporter [Frankia torreyi]KQC37461.1 magnesium transporter [Frankia sp. ACN1ag]KQM02294.1 Mg2+/Co2+ transporter [Frankia sp. CpI1-P]
MEIRLLTDAGVERHPAEALRGLIAAGEGLVWVDMPSCDDAGTQVLSDIFGFHPLAVRDCVERNRVPKVRAYADHVFVVLHAPERGAGGHVHYVELDQFIGPRYLVTVHGPANPAVDLAAMLRETGEIAARLDTGRLRPTSPFDLVYAIGSALARRQEAFIEATTGEVWRLEQRVTGGHLGDPEQLLDELFRARHGLLAVRTMGALGREALDRLSVLARTAPPGPPGPPGGHPTPVAPDSVAIRALLAARPLVDDLADQFDRIRALADAQRDYLQGVIEFYRTLTETKMTIAAERFAVIAAVTLPITALSSVLGMNLIVNDRSRYPELLIVLAVMAAMSATVLRWARRRGWW